MTRKPRTRFRKFDGLLSLAWALLLLVGAGQAYGADREAPSDAEFGRRLRTLADSDRLHDVDYIGSVLGLRFELDERFEPDVYPCPGGGGNYKKYTTRYLARTDGWYRAMPDAKAALFANSSDRVKEYVGKHGLQEPAIRLMAYRQTPCVSGDPERNEASLDFEGLRAFGCFGKVDAAVMVDGMEHDIHTDGASSMGYRGWRSEYGGTQLSFEYGSGSHCAAAIDLSQAAQFGFLEQRARIGFDRCMADAVKRYCAMPVGQRKGRLDDYELEQCHGSFDGFVQHEPRTGRPPAPRAAEPARPGQSYAEMAEEAAAAAQAAADAAAGAVDASNDDFRCRNAAKP